MLSVVPAAACGPVSVPAPWLVLLLTTSLPVEKGVNRAEQQARRTPENRKCKPGNLATPQLQSRAALEGGLVPLGPRSPTSGTRSQGPIGARRPGPRTAAAAFVGRF